MKIIFDNIVFSLQKAGGISVFWYEIIRKATVDKDFEAVFIDYQNNRQNIFACKLDIKTNQISEKSDFLLTVRRYFNPYIKLDKKFIFHSSYYRSSYNIDALNITTVHDFTYEKYRTGIKKWLHCLQKYRAIKKSDIIVCISENTKKDLLFYLPKINSDKIRIIYNGVSDDYFRLPINKPKKSRDLSLYVLYVGSRESYKRFDLAVKALKDLEYKLYIIGGGALSKKENEFLTTELGETRFKFLGNVSNETLNQLYNKAFCLIYPSEYEGFGIPVIEAQKAGCPVIAYNGSSITEIVKESALLFINCNSEKEIFSLLVKLKDEEVRNQVINKGILNAENFSWDITYNKYKNLYKEILNNGK